MYDGAIVLLTVRRMPKKPQVRKSASTSGRMDIRDVAKKAGVSIATVSRTINRVPTVNAKLAARVRQAIRQLDYYPNTQARALVSGRSRLIGLLVSDITNPFFPELIKCFEKAAVEHGYEILIGSTEYDSELEHCLRRMVERDVDGVAVMTFGVEDPILDELSSRNIPMVFMDVPDEESTQDTLRVDYTFGLTEAVQHVVALGHTQIAFITGPLHQHSALQRRNAFLASMEQAGCLPDERFVVEGDHQLEGGIRETERLLKFSVPPTAILCSNDMMAIGALNALHQRGFSVPRDMSVIGFDDIHLTEFVNPPLTTVAMSRVDIARGAMKILLNRIEKLSGKEGRLTGPVSTKLVIRETTAPPRARGAARLGIHVSAQA